MTLQLIWLIVSYALIYAVGGVLIEEVGALWGLAFVVTLPAVRVYRRFLPGKGYYLIGYQGEVGGDQPTRRGLLTRTDDPRRFKLLFVAENGRRGLLDRRPLPSGAALGPFVG